MLVILQAELMQWDSMCQTLHDRVEKACVTSVLHPECYFLVGHEQTLSKHQVVNLTISSFLEIAFEICLVKLSFLPFIFQLLSSFWRYGWWRLGSVEGARHDHVVHLVLLKAMRPLMPVALPRWERIGSASTAEGVFFAIHFRTFSHSLTFDEKFICVI